MLRIIPLLLFAFGISATFFSFYFNNVNNKLLIILCILLALASIFLGISVYFIQNAHDKHFKIKKLFLVISLLLLALCLISGFYHLPGTNLEGILAVFFYCFAYAPLELYLKYEKWRIYSSNKWEVLILSSLDFIGVNLILIGILSRVLHWPGQFILIYTGAGLLLVGLFLWNLRFKQEVVSRKKSEDMIKLQYEIIEKEKDISETLLLNILPEEVANELKAKGSADAKMFDEVTVLFTDFKDFTQITETMSPKELVEELNIFFRAFDNIISKLNIEKIKTIGDSYMCVGGLPTQSHSHAEDVVKAGLEIQLFVEHHAAQKVQLGNLPLQIRIGIHSGPVVAGIVGIKKYAYDIWGDTVNTASRMESSGEAGKVNISKATYNLVKEKFICTARGKIVAKHKGEMEMYFVEGEK